MKQIWGFTLIRVRLVDAAEDIHLFKGPLLWNFFETLRLFGHDQGDLDWIARWSPCMSVIIFFNFSCIIIIIIIFNWLCNKSKRKGSSPVVSDQLVVKLWNGADEGVLWEQEQLQRWMEILCAFIIMCDMFHSIQRPFVHASSEL